MIDSEEELLSIASDLRKLAARGEDPAVQQPLERLQRAAEEVGKAWGGSWIGHQANVYFRGLQRPPPGNHFNLEVGLMSGERGWLEWDRDEVNRIIYERAGNPDMDPAEKLSTEARTEFRKQKKILLSIVEVESSSHGSEFLSEQKQAITGLSLSSQKGYLEEWRPSQFISSDITAMQQGTQVPPHKGILAGVLSIKDTIYDLGTLAEMAESVASHLSRMSRREQQPRPGSTQGESVVIGHGGSETWRALKDFLKDEMSLSVEEFNSVPTAGTTTIQRLSDLLASAAIAFLVMTGEDEQPSGELRARENVVHEAGLFQGRLGFEQAIILLEEGCQKFSNIEGLVHISFPKRNIKAAFHDIRQVLEREGFLEEKEG